jgi:predicted DNA-binding protein (UPF0251 family)
MPSQYLRNPGQKSFQTTGDTCCRFGRSCFESDEFEAIRLADYEQLYQEEAANHMNISRQTFGRIIDAAHKR